MSALKTLLAAVETAAAAAENISEEEVDDAPAEVEGVVEVIYPDPEETSNMIAAREQLAKFQEAKEYVDDLETLDRDAYRKVASYIERPGKSPGAPTFGMTGYTVRPSRPGMWPLPDGSGHVKPKSNEPEGRELEVRLANSQKCYDAAQTVKHMDRKRKWTEYGMAMRSFLENGELEGARKVIAIWLNFYQVYTECWPRSKYAPEPWQVQ